MTALPAVPCGMEHLAGLAQPQRAVDGNAAMGDLSHRIADQRVSAPGGEGVTCILTVQGACVSDWLGNLGSRWQKAVRDVKEQLQGPGPDMTLAREPLLVRCDRSRPAADVLLDPDAQQRLTPTRNLSPPPDFSEIFVLLAGAEGNDGQHIEVYIGEHRLGTLTTTDSADFRAVLAAAKSQDKPVAGQAIRDRDASGAWALHVYRPEPT